MKRKGTGDTRRGLAFLSLVSCPLFILPALAAKPADEGWTVLLSGDADGILAPCGCTSPQQGGMKRRATALREGDARTVRLDNGGLAGGTDRQHVLKAEAAAQALDRSGVDAANLGAADARLGESGALGLARLSGGRLVSTSLRPSATAPVPPWRAAGPFLVGGATARPELLAATLRESALSPVEAAHRLATEAADRGLAPVLLFDGGVESARAVARAEPALRLVTFRATGRPPAELLRQGSCALATPGESGKAVVRLVWREGAFVSSALRTLGPEVRDDARVEELYRRYLEEVSRANLLETSPHVSAKGFAGSARCLPCHAASAKVWRASAHAHALKTLEKTGNGRDPDCVPCHVVGESHRGMEPRMAFRSRLATPALANVGCESCHGAAAAHAAAPRRFVLPKVGEASCKPCHTLENSPRFEFVKYWAWIKH